LLRRISDRVESVNLTDVEISKAISLEPSIMRALTHFKFVQYILEALIHPKRSVKARSCIERAAAILAVIPSFRVRLSSLEASGELGTSLETIRRQFQTLLSLRSATSELLTLVI
jgi:hypothetical protein